MAKEHSGKVAGTQTLVNGLDVLRAVAGGTRSMKVLQKKMGLPRSTVQRLVASLRNQGFLRDTESGLVLGPSLISMGFAALDENPLVDVASPSLNDLSGELLDTVHLATEEDDSVLYLAKLPGSRGAEMRSQVGQRMPLTRTGVGKALLLLDGPERWRAMYDHDREVPLQAGITPRSVEDFVSLMAIYHDLGFTLDIEENELGILCVAAPVLDVRGRIVAAISVSATTPFMGETRMRAMVPVVIDHARQISIALGCASPGWGPTPMTGLPHDELVEKAFAPHPDRRS